MGNLFPPVGIILAGGKSRRFGQDKAWVNFQGRPFVTRLFGLFSGFFPQVYVVLHEEDPRFADLPVLLDIFPEGGPMNGIYSALIKTGAEAVLVTACDLPLLNGDLLRAMVSSRRRQDRALVCSRQDCWEPLCGIYSRALIPSLAESLENGNYRLQDYLTAVKATPFRLVPHDAEKLLWNVNTPYDMLRLNKEFGHESSNPSSHCLGINLSSTLGRINHDD